MVTPTMVQATWADPHQKATKDGPTDANEGIITDNMSKLAFITGLPLLSHVMTVIFNVSEVKIRKLDCYPGCKCDQNNGDVW